MVLRFNGKSPLLQQLAKRGLEFDQKLKRALEVSASSPDLEPEDRGFPDSYLTLALYRSNSVLTSVFTLDESRYNLFHEYKLAPACGAGEVVPGSRLCSVLDKAVESAKPGKTIGAGHYLRAIVSLTLDHAAWSAPGFPGSVLHRTFSAETILWGLGHTAWTPLTDAPEVAELMAALDGRHPVDDCQYLMAIERGKLVVRPASALGSFRMSSESTDERLGVLTHLKDQFAAVAPDELLELEDLINPRAREAELQRFFERHPHFFRMWDYREVFPQVYLTREDEGPFVPDFLLLDRALQKALIVDLKLPSARAVVAKKNRERFSSLVAEARAQLLAYRDWFEDRSNRSKLKDRFGMEIYRPRLGMIIGSANEFDSAFQKQRLRSQFPDVEIATYEDVLECAQRRMAIVRSAHR